MAKGFRNPNLTRARPLGYWIGLAAVFMLVFFSYLTMSRTNSMRIPVGGPSEFVKHVERNPICDLSNNKSDICEANGDVRIIGKDIRMVFVAPQSIDIKENDSWTIKPYARKWDEGSGARVRPVTLKLVYGHPEDKPCLINHTVPAMVFAIGGWSGTNYFHDFVDVLVPLFETAHPFGGEVQFLIANMDPQFMNKYKLFFKKLSRYDFIGYDNDDRIHCFQHVTLGLRCTSTDDFQMEPSKSPHGYTMFHFANFMRSVFSLEREYPVNLKDAGQSKKPKLMIITRINTRKFMNVEEILNLAQEVGYEVVITEGDSDLSKFSRIVNSCDVLMGVHGSALTNMVFLPTNGVVIQVVPWGNLDWIAGHYFREPAKQMKLNYLEYSINEEETTLTELYPRDHAVFKDPMSLHPQNANWETFSRIFLKEQNVRLDVKRFKPFLEHALQIFGEQQ
ncbi:alpha-1,3-arabinosyltransferase XAT2-like [Zingiber officinale]|uniref:Glycosyltransferase 61 catalytic domain-containing protein n=1 Tax=Zingiber officinale TaxID=94328 RepID=A0A8J5KR54_ZINOF|nr:alpha-1,3-arabinosyltransferase XAT2-like [Zingiber officinale]KAG6485840.1 hypothetical protein ZIOFF_054405 [Zingiber officinale]